MKRASLFYRLWCALRGHAGIHILNDVEHQGRAGICKACGSTVGLI